MQTKPWRNGKNIIKQMKTEPRKHTHTKETKTEPNKTKSKKTREVINNRNNDIKNKKAVEKNQ